MANTPTIKEIFVTDVNGFNVEYSNRTSDFVQSDEHWWQTAMEEGINISEPEFDPSAGVFAVDVAMRIEDAGEPVGVLKAALDVALVQSIANRFTGTNDNYDVAILDADGRLLAETSSGNEPSHIMNSAYVLADAVYSNARIAEALAPNADELHPNGFSIDEEFVGGYANVEEQLAAMRSDMDRDVRAFGWTVIVEQPSEVAFAALAPIRNLIAFGGAAAVGFAALLAGAHAQTLSPGPDTGGDLRRQPLRLRQKRFEQLRDDTIRPVGHGENALVTVEAVEEVALHVAMARRHLGPEGRQSSPATPDRGHVRGSFLVQTSTGLLDQVVSLVGELVLARNQMAQNVEDGKEVETQTLTHITTALQEQALRTRMQRIGSAWKSLPRAVRDVSKVAGKKARLEMVGEGLADSMPPGIHGYDHARVRPLRVGPDFDNRSRVGQIRLVQWIERTCGNRQGTVNRVGARIGTDRVAFT